MTIDNRLESLRPQFQPTAQAWLEMVSAYILPLRFNGFKVKVTETLRTAERQEAVHADGASQLKKGWHNFGLALDFAIFDASGIYITDGGHTAYWAAGQAAKALGCVWGGDWMSLKDSGHIEYHPGFTLAQFDAALTSGKDLFA